jgi:uncharacterized membrane protein YfcA
MEWLIFAGLGVIAGLLAGLLGVGGGIIIVPTLVFTFHLLDFSDQVLMHMAVGTSLGTIVPTSLGSIYQHQRKQAVLWGLLRPLALGLVLGAILGAWVAEAITGQVLQRMFGAFTLVVAIQMMLGRHPEGQHRPPGSVGLVGVGSVIGMASSLFGIGGGSMMVPFLTWCRTSMQQAVATSSAGGLPIALAGAVSFMATGWNQPELPAYSLGYLYLPALLGIAVTSIVFAQVGARWAHRLPASRLKKGFALLLVLVGVRLLLG